ncbi:MAG: preprotein translocase subunit SecY [Anaerolineae bacterium]|nr:preprotein translocase subunit SecY [Anaerolineae bacterium]
MIESVRNAFALPDLRRKILYTIFLLVIYRLVANIPVPGVDLVFWQALKAGTESFGANSLVGVLNLLSGGAVGNFSVLAMGVYPYITASIIMQLLSPVIPYLQELDSEGESGRNRKNKLTYYLTIPLAVLQAVGQINLVALSVGTPVSAIMPNFGFTAAANILPTLATILAMVGGTMFAIWLGELITENGIGQGISLIIFSGIIAEAPRNLLGLTQLDAQTQVFAWISFVVLTVLTILVIVVVQEGQRRIPVQYGRRVRGRKVYQGQSTHIPLKVNYAGMIPIIFAQSIMTFPGLIASFFLPEAGAAPSGFIQNFATTIDNSFGQAQGFLYWFTFFLMVFAFSFFYTDVMVKQQKLPEMLQRNGGFVPGIRPGKRTEEYITKVVRRITFVGAFFLATVAILPGLMAIVGYFLNMPDLQRSTLVVSGSGLIIVVGVIIDTMRQLEAQLLMRHYEGF